MFRRIGSALKFIIECKEIYLPSLREWYKVKVLKLIMRGRT